MDTFTKILKGKDIRNIVDIPDNLNDKDVKITVEVIGIIENNTKKDNRLERLFKKTKKLNFRIADNVNVDRLIDEMYDRNTI